jgi:D-alanine-D-alanine ligase
MTVLALYTLPPASVSATRIVAEFDLAEAAQAIAGVFPDGVAAGVEGTALEIVEQLRTHRPTVVFNLCEAPLGRPDLEAHAAALFEWMGVRFTGSRASTLALCRRKDLVDAVLDSAGIPTPRRGRLFPCIVKPADEDGSVGISSDSVCENDAQVEAALLRLAKPAVVQEFLPGREFAVSLWGRAEPDFSTIGETTFRNGLMLNTYAAKWDVGSADYANSPLRYNHLIEPSLRDEIEKQGRAVWRAVDARGYLRVDVRQDHEGRPRVIDVNPNPDIGIGAGISRAVVEAGWRWEDFIRRQVEWA